MLLIFRITKSYFIFKFQIKRTFYVASVIRLPSSPLSAASEDIINLYNNQSSQENQQPASHYIGDIEFSFHKSYL